MSNTKIWNGSMRNPTDNISVDPPAEERKFQRVFDQMMTKPEYNRNVESTNNWVPFYSENCKSISNKSNATHNIITHQKNSLSLLAPPSVNDKKLANRKKGICEFGDLYNPNALNINKDHLKAFEENPSVFKKKNDVFTHLYDAAHRFGEDKPFKA